jgi:anion-transporting  ArsA/GET3 family ATPase
MTPLEERRFLFVTGKGGTGKTTVTTALALALAARGRRVLITVTEPKERIASLLGVAPLGPDIREVLPSIFAVKISPEVAMREYGEMVLGNRTLARTVFDNKYTRGFFAAVPGLHAWAMLGKAWFHSTELDDAGHPRFDVVLFDAPATGHGLEMLRVPKVIVETVPPGVLRRDAEKAWAQFQNPAESGVLIVALPEDMPAVESVELGRTITSELGLPIAAVIVNQVVPQLFDEAERAALTPLSELGTGDPGEAAVRAGARRAITEGVQEESLAKLRGIGAPLVTLPRLLVDPSTPEAMRGLAAAMAQRLFPLPAH